MGCSPSKEKSNDRRGLLAADDDDFPNPRRRMDINGPGINAGKKEAKESSKKTSSKSSNKPNSSKPNSSKPSKAVEAPKEKRPEQQQQQQQQAAVPPKEKAAPPNGAPSAAPSVAAVKQQTKNTPYNRAKDRVDAIECTKSIETRDIKFRYAYLSQRGYYPDDPFKANQDAYKVQERVLFHPRDAGKKNEASKYQHANQRKDAFFGVFDGHGKDGDGCAIYARDHIVEQLETALCMTIKAKKSCELNKDEIQAALLHAHVETNKGLHKSAIDDSLSGTTAISMYMHGRRNRITICNVGDSRAVLAQDAAVAAAMQSGETPAPEMLYPDLHHSHDSKPEKTPMAKRCLGALQARPLSRDQTPYRKDERARVRACGARVMSLDQLEGLEPVVEGESENFDDFELGEDLDEGGDPPRIWAANGDYPGTAFTRSIGDAMAEELGVFAEPEMLTRELGPEDKIIVLASDGVFEFLTNQSVIDICAKFADPLEACRAVVAEAYELWLQYELRTDDITIIVIFIDEIRVLYDRRGSMCGSVNSSNGKNKDGDDKTGSGVPGRDDTVDDSILTTEGMRPVRKNVSKEKSKEIERLKEMGKGMRGDADDSHFDWHDLATEKTEEEKKGIAEAIKASVMFRNITDEQREMIFACMESVPVKKGTWVIRQGTVGDRFYIIDEGRFEVRILPDDEEDVTGEGGNTVHVYEGSRKMNLHPAFGELALMYSAPRSASIVAQADGHLWALHRSAFRSVLVQAQDHRKELKKVLGEIPYFQYLDSDGINSLATIMDEITFGRGENIVEQGKPGKSVYVISSGSCYSVQMLPGQTKRGTLKAGSYFGDEIMAGKGSYTMTVVTLQTANCWKLDVDVMKQTMGPLLRAGGPDQTIVEA
jgi:serine/threonine protein phosphatase PrpC/CRP-like cAMP-binding protein